MVSNSSHFTLANAIRALSMDAVQKANSGHPGMPMGMADIATVLWQDFLKHNPKNPKWINRDRFILSNGHGCMLQYALLHLSGYDLSIEDIQQFRQLHSKTPGHPEYGVTPGVETTTGPLGQGLASAVGMALGEEILAASFNRGKHKIVDHYTYCFVGDGCLMEGISHEVVSLAGTLGLKKLIVFWDDNGISIDGKVEKSFCDNTAERFRAYGWHVISNVDGHKPEQIAQAIEQARAQIQKPTLICCKTIIGFGAPTLSGTEKIHGQALGEKEIEGARKQLGWEYPPFVIPNEIYQAWNAVEQGKLLEAEWNKKFQEYAQEYPELAAEFNRRKSGRIPSTLYLKLESFISEVEQKAETIATRKASQNVLNLLVENLPELLGGSADLTESTLTHTAYSTDVQPLELKGNYIYYGVREFGMSAIMNGLALYQGFIPYGGTFLTFLDYARSAVRMAALMKQRAIFVYTHDSIGLGEDGPTHQPIEHLSILRSTPNVSVWRPADATETAVAWMQALKRTDGPSCLCFTRQALKHPEKTAKQVSNIAKGAYIIWESQRDIDVIILATGSELQCAIEAAKQLDTLGHAIRVVSMPSMDVFMAQDKTYREKVIPSAIRRRVAVEAGATQCWHQWVGLDGIILGIDSFGESAPAAKLMEYFNITSKAIISAVQKVLAKEEQTNEY